MNTTEELHNRPHVVIVGGGFGGLRAARALRSASVKVTLLDRRNYHLFQPLLYQVATGSLAPAEIAAPLRSIFSRQKNTKVLIGDVKDVHPAVKRVVLADGGVFEYDYLIVAAGSQTSYYGNDGWREWAPGLKSIEEAIHIRHKILYAFEAAERIEDPELRREWLTFVIAGGGATGVELAGAIAEIAQQTLKDDFRSIHPDEARIVLLDGAPRVLGPFPEVLSRKAESSLAKLGVQVRTGVVVKSVDRGGLTLERGASVERLPSRTVIWAGGVTAASIGRILAERTHAETDRSGRIVVGPDLTIPGYPDIYVVGDLALCRDRKGKPLPGVAQVAMQQGTYAARAILKQLSGKTGPPPFEYFDKGTLAVIGRAAAVADVFGLHISGLPAWLIWVFIHLMYIVEFQSRLLVFIRWAYEDLTFNRGARLITGTAATDFDPYRDILGHEIRPGADPSREATEMKV
ncbi:MAG TPA: NAD(P)/FAD-dependent oxidoreductase [Bryobacteraceae bacterium]|nr:NAD(P)/FAD-dependent oxidoreductase [Bryobacteraceae bacterium]HVO97639.1 NAD(P)/FAD-dependent oxidoreductase [Bryobacteraceae bacterium]